MIMMFGCFVMMFCRLLGHESSSFNFGPVELHWAATGST